MRKCWAIPILLLFLICLSLVMLINMGLLGLFLLSYELNIYKHRYKIQRFSFQKNSFSNSFPFRNCLFKRTFLRKSLWDYHFKQSFRSTLRPVKFTFFKTPLNSYAERGDIIACATCMLQISSEMQHTWHIYWSRAQHFRNGNKI
jgi:hypothetical protein